VTEPAVPEIRCRGLTKRFGGVTAVDHLDLDVWHGTIVSILGPSGCGKTTALRLLAGFEEPDGGWIRIGGRVVAAEDTWSPPERRSVGMVFQDHALFPHLSVSANVGFGLAKGDRARVGDVLDLVGLGDLADRMPAELSGGQRQRVALARALAPEPRVVLLDEPFSSLDAALRAQVRDEVGRILREAGATAVLVTHDQEEALSFSDVVAVMRAGRVVQAGRPSDLYLDPVDAWVAGFVGDADFVDGTVREGRVETAIGHFRAGAADPGAARVMIRPESVALESSADGPGTVVDRHFYGHDQVVTVRLGDVLLRSRLGPTPTFRPGDRVAVRVGDVRVFPSAPTA
jgi:iron(III) transport system ATP-binding protein